MTFCAIMSLSLIVNLPGLAITPMLGTLHKIFPDTTQLEDQLLTVLPNLLIIPFVLLSGKLSLARHRIRIVVVSLIIFCASAVAYMFARTMGQLIIISCLLGCGTGLLIPFSTGLIADTFCGSYRLRVMGLQSGLSNTIVMLATFAVSWLCMGHNWHMPFAVYLIGVVPMVLSFWLKGISDNERELTDMPDATCDDKTPCGGHDDGSITKKEFSAPQKAFVKDGFYVGRILSLVGVYFFITFATICISYYCPYLIEKKGWSDALTGTITALYFLFIFLPGYILPWFVRHLGNNCFVFSALCMTIGIGLFAFYPDSWTLCIGASLAGLGYGICQPILYDKASVTVKSENKATLALSLVLSANYLAIVLSPFIIDLFRNIFKAENVTGFAFILCFVLLICFTILTFVRRGCFAFSTADERSAEKSHSVESAGK
ncbi:MAG: MFS transporter [Bacteroidales bacterium]|nr:MFS transporter [Bacteroidales bacterium]